MSIGAPEAKVSRNLSALAHSVDSVLLEVAGERMGFCILVFPLGRTGGTNYAGNVNRADLQAQLEQLLERWRAGAPDVPLHEQH